MTDAPSTQPDGTGLIARDPWLEAQRDVLRKRFDYIQQVRARYDDSGGLAGDISKGHHYFGFNRGERDGAAGVWYREWAPGAHILSLIGDFNNWDRSANPMQRDDFGVWSCFMPDSEYADRLTHDSPVKVYVSGEGGANDKIPAYIQRVTQVPDTIDFVGHFWHPPDAYQWQNDSPCDMQGGLRIYEAHVGMATEEGRVGTFEEFTRDVLPRIAELGYNAVQLMAVQEHPYYGSFGYHVSNMFAVSSRFGTPGDLKKLIDTAHGLGLRVIMDIVHSHMVKNTAEGLNRFDGTDHQYFHGPPRGDHVAWDSKCFDYSQHEVMRILLSNCRYWLEEFRFDGFRFDGVTSMLYLDHGLGRDFETYDDYFGPNTDWDSVAYLTLANDLIHTVKPGAITVAEDMSGMPGTARPTVEGGLGFDYRLAMGVPDYWIKLLKEKTDEQWDLGTIFGTLLNRRRDEKHIGYAESHDQALVGDKTIAFRLMDKDMYEAMSVLNSTPVVDRGLALHKLIRLLTFTLSGEGYLNFMGNEFGHPEWIDFPREGNDYSYHYARRQWSLADTEHLRYKGLNAFDRAMQKLDADHNLLDDPFIEQLVCHEDSRQLVYRRGPLVFAFNLHPTESYSDLRIPVPDATDYECVLSTDAKSFEGHGHVEPGGKHVWLDESMYDRPQSTLVYLPTRSAIVLVPIKSHE